MSRITLLFGSIEGAVEIGWWGHQPRRRKINEPNKTFIRLIEGAVEIGWWGHQPRRRKKNKPNSTFIRLIEGNCKYWLVGTPTSTNQGKTT